MGNVTGGRVRGLADMYMMQVIERSTNKVVSEFGPYTEEAVNKRYENSAPVLNHRTHRIKIVEVVRG